jgi:hypothetical protein
MRRMSILILALTLCAAGARAEVIDRVMAVVGDHLILLSDVRTAQALGLVPVNAGEGTDDIVARLIDRELILEEVNRYAPPEPESSAVDAELAAARGRFASASAFAATLTRIGVDERELREMLRQNLRVRAYITQRFGAETPEQAQIAIGEWVAGLRRRTDIVLVPAGGSR